MPRRMLADELLALREVVVRHLRKVELVPGVLLRDGNGVVVAAPPSRPACGHDGCRTVGVRVVADQKLTPPDAPTGTIASRPRSADHHGRNRDGAGHRGDNEPRNPAFAFRPRLRGEINGHRYGDEEHHDAGSVDGGEAERKSACREGHSLFVFMPRKRRYMRACSGR